MARIYLRKNVQLIFASSLMGVMGVSLISPVFPSLMGFFDISGQEISLVVTAYTVPGIFVTPFIGAFADRFGRKKVLIPLLLLFGFSGTGCGFVESFSTLLFLRVFQGIGGAGLVTIAITLIGDYFDGLERGKVMGWNGAAISVGTASYPFIGGVLGIFGWFAPFFVYFSGVVVGLVSIFFLQEPEIEKERVFKKYLKKVLRIASKPETILATFTALLSFVLLYGAFITYLPLLLDEKFALNSLEIGLIMSFMSIVTGIVSSQTGKFLARFSHQTLFTSGFLAYGFSLLIIPFIESIYLFTIPLTIYGIGQGLVIPNLQTFMTSLAPDQMRGATMSLYNIGLRVGQTVGPTILALIYIHGLTPVFLFSGILGLIGFIVLTFLKRVIGVAD